MSSSAGRPNFPGHFSSSPSPPSSPAGSHIEKALQIPHAAADSDFNLPGAYPPSPRMPQPRHEGAQAGSGVSPGAGGTMRGAMQRLPSGDADATRRQPSERSGSTHRAGPRKESGCEDTSLADAERSIGNLDLNKDGERDIAKQNNHSDYETPDANADEDEDAEDARLANTRPRPPSRIDLHATSPAPELPTRSPLRSGFRARGRGESAIESADADVGESESDSENQESHPDASNEDDRRPDDNTDEQEQDPQEGAHRSEERSDKSSRQSQSQSSQPKPQPQPTLNATPTHAHVKDGAGVRIGGPVGMLRAPGIEERMAEGGDARDAQDTDRLDQDQEAAAAREHEHDNDHDRNQDYDHDHDNRDSASTDSFIDVRGEHHPLSSSSSTGRDLSPSASSDEEHAHAGHAGPGAIAGAGGGGKDIDGKRKSGGLISKMRRTLSKATNGGGRHVS